MIEKGSKGISDGEAYGVWRTKVREIIQTNKAEGSNLKVVAKQQCGRLTIVARDQRFIQF
jgi:hypothetical protein